MFSLPVNPALVGLPCPNVIALFSTIQLTWLASALVFASAPYQPATKSPLWGERKQLAELIVFLYKRGKNKRWGGISVQGTKVSTFHILSLYLIPVTLHEAGVNISHYVRTHR